MPKGRIVSNISNMYEVEIDNKIYKCNARGKLKKEEMSPTVGDIVETAIVDNTKKEATIEAILQRNNYLKRPKISNITQLMLVCSSKMPKIDLLMLDKQLAFAEFLHIKPIIILNKIDLEKAEEIEKNYTNIGYTVIKTIANKAEGLEELEKYLKNNVSVFAGNSGVGKSTLINNIFKSNITEEGNISKKNKKGKNTTTYTKLYKIEENSYIADTPGFSTFDIFEIEKENLYKYFKEFTQYEKECEFVGCTHIKEQNCGIRKAYENKKISETRYNNYVKIYNDLKEREEQKW